MDHSMEWIVIIFMLMGYIIINIGITRIFHPSNHTPVEPNIGSTDYSKNILEFTKTLASSIALLKFKTFEDNHNMNKITKENFKKLTNEVAVDVHNAIDKSKIDFNMTIFTEEFYDLYIVEMSIYAVKSLLGNYIDQ